MNQVTLTLSEDQIRLLDQVFNPVVEHYRSELNELLKNRYDLDIEKSADWSESNRKALQRTEAKLKSLESLQNELTEKTALINFLNFQGR